MHIIMGDQVTKELQDKYIMLELDLFQTDAQGSAMPAYCLVENVPLEELPQADRWQDLHRKLIENYRIANWTFCEHALEHLEGRWNGEVDSFYRVLRTRIQDLRDQDCALPGWDPVIKI
jgi:hypothetical protein